MEWRDTTSGSYCTHAGYSKHHYNAIYVCKYLSSVSVCCNTIMCQEAVFASRGVSSSPTCQRTMGTTDDKVQPMYSTPRWDASYTYNHYFIDTDERAGLKERKRKTDEEALINVTTMAEGRPGKHPNKAVVVLHTHTHTHLVCVLDTTCSALWIRSCEWVITCECHDWTPYATFK